MKQKISKFFSDARIRMLLLFLISTVYIQAQSGRIVTGVVKDATGETVIGVNVTVRVMLLWVLLPIWTVSIH